ncbi:FtsX-like permease family protein [Streptomyces massasporeus]|uniref:FtsX-like permease family protein n=1 Tax=Streptomyces massasporeus TaxID=67324 RepID=UPI0037A9821C
MFRLILTDLLDTARIWLGATLVAAVAAVAGAVAASDVQTAVQTGGTASLALYGISGTVILFCAATTFVVLGTVIHLAVTLHQRSYALWQLVGLAPGHVRAVVQAQLGIIALVGGIAGCAAAAPAVGPLFRFCFADVPELRGVTPGFGPTAAGAVVIYVLLVVILGGARGARRAARTPALEALREPEAPSRTMNKTRWVTGAALAALLISVVAGLPDKEADQIASPLMLIGPLTAGLLAALGPLYLAALLRVWTAVVPTTAFAWWHLARNSAAHHVSRSAGAVHPLVVAVSLAGGLYAAQGTASGGRSVPVGGVVLILGGPLLLSLTGAAVTLFMAGRQREREIALLLAAGATTATVVAVAASEAVIFVVTAALLGGTAVLTTGLAGAWALQTPPSFGLGATATVLGAGLALLLAATVIPTLLALRKDTVRTLTAE